MTISSENKENILKRIENIPPQEVQKVIDFIDYLTLQSRSKSSAIDKPYLLLQQNTLAKIWQDEEDLYEL